MANLNAEPFFLAFVDGPADVVLEVRGEVPRLQASPTALLRRRRLRQSQLRNNGEEGDQGD